MAGVPVWSHAGIICTGETYKKAMKMTFVKGASMRRLPLDPSAPGRERRELEFAGEDARAPKTNPCRTWALSQFGKAPSRRKFRRPVPGLQAYGFLFRGFASLTPRL